MKYKKFKKTDGLEPGDIFYKFDNDLKELPPLKLIATNWCKKCFDDGDEYSEFEQIFPDSVMSEWEAKYGQNKRKWKKFLKEEVKKTGWFFFDDIYVEDKIINNK